MLLTVGAAGMSLLTAWALVTIGPTTAGALALLPLLALGMVYLVTSGQVLLWAAAVALPFWFWRFIGGGSLVGNVYPQDLVAVLALCALLFALFLGSGKLPVPRTPVLGWPFVLFAAVILSATVRGHYAYGASLVGQPLRLFLYAAIVAGLIGMSVPRMYRLLVILFYPGAILAALMSALFVANGGSGDAAVLSTGGLRPVPISISIFCAGALFLALLNLRLAHDPRARFLHLTIAGIALFGVLAGFGRSTWIAVALVCALFFVTSTRLRANALSIVPLAAPFVVLIVIGVSHAAPGFISNVGSRVGQTTENDINVRFRIEANRLILNQVREHPLFGVGFGKTTELLLANPDPATGVPSLERILLGQDPHNGYVFLLAGGGILAFGSFAVLVAVFAYDVRRRYRSTTDPIARLILLWTCSMLFVWLLTAASGTTFESTDNVLMIWALLVLPAVVRPDADPRPARNRPQTAAG